MFLPVSAGNSWKTRERDRLRDTSLHLLPTLSRLRTGHPSPLPASSLVSIVAGLGTEGGGAVELKVPYLQGNFEDLLETGFRRFALPASVAPSLSRSPHVLSCVSVSPVRG